MRAPRSLTANIPGRLNVAAEDPGEFYKGRSQEKTLLHRPKFFLLPSPGDEAGSALTAGTRCAVAGREPDGQRRSPGWSGLAQKHSSCLWFQMLGVEAHSCLPHDQNDRGNLRRMYSTDDLVQRAVQALRKMQRVEAAKVRFHHG